MIRASVAVLGTLTAAWLASGRQLPEPPVAPRLTDVYVAGEGAYHTYRIPSIIATPKGTLLAFAEGRRAGAGDAGDIDLVMTAVPPFRKLIPIARWSSHPLRPA